MKEYGGYLPLELNCNYQEPFEKNGEDNFIRVNCGRTAFWYALKVIQPQKVFVPYLNCKNSTDPMDDLGIPYEYYSLADDLTPKNINPTEKDAVIWVNYYGNASVEQKNKVNEMCKHTNLIIDNCHAFYSLPITGAYNCYSMRKFFGVCDGAYLVKEGITKMDLEPSYSAENIGFILRCIERGTNACYLENLKNEERLASEYKSMSVLTQKILKTIDYNSIKEKRNNNFRVLHQRIKELNEFSVNEDSDTHMYYPLLICNDLIRDKLIHRKIYTPTWWRHVPDYFCDNDNLETKLSKYMLMIPIDQRYSQKDMHVIADIIEEEYHSL